MRKLRVDAVILAALRWVLILRVDKEGSSRPGWSPSESLIERIRAEQSIPRSPETKGNGKMLEQSKREAEHVTGVSNVTYDMLAILTSALEGCAALEMYKQDAQKAGDRDALELFEHIQEHEVEEINQLKSFLRKRLQ